MERFPGLGAGVTSVLGILPARAGSKGIPGKNLVPIAGKPLVYWAAKALAEAPSISRAICSTDSPEISEVAQEAGLEVPFRRPKELAEDNSMVKEVILHALAYMERLHRENYSHVVLAQATAPTVTSVDIDCAVELASRSNYSSVISASVVPPEYNPAVTFTAQENGVVNWTLGKEAASKRRQDWPSTYARTGLVYVFSVRQLIENNELYGDNVGFIEVEPERAIAIDAPRDLMVIRNYFETQL